MTVLIVDDSQVNRKLLRAQLEAEGYTTIEAENGLAALKQLKREKIDAIISDILMPGMDGYRLCSKVKRSKKFKRIPIIFYTATYTSPADEKLAIGAGADKYLRKPAPVELIVQTLRELATRKSRRLPGKVPVDSVGVTVLAAQKDDEFVKRLLGTFKVEAAEHVSCISSGLLELKKIAGTEKQQEILDALFREVHTLKGAARAVKQAEIATICESLESLFAAWKRKDVNPAPELFGALQETVAKLGRLI
ncbi:MAG: hypothetical protein A3F90_20410 [Deltaproteobacteria bacterium RIFCSPLOWO2_12_FULL_60_19]|nr:MAG: hypothetical protein A3F90_20410 [Deltaproteobacteria bacterium RIFCSPLOWO2_12_FULL_60_19]